MEYDFALILWAAYVAVFIVILGRIILRPQREPASRLAWLIATIAVPVVGILAYLLLGEARISAKRRARYAAIEAHLPHPHDNAGVRRALARSPWAAPFALAETVNALPPTAGNRAHLAADSNAAIREMVEDIDNAKSTVHLCFYIWLADNNGFRIKDALVRAARRGVKVRVLADALGSRGFIRSAYWIELENAAVGAPGVQEAAAVGGFHPKWDERPILLIVRKPGAEATEASILDYLKDKVAKWWLPDEIVFVDELPHTATGKILKRQIRDDYKDYKLRSLVGA